MEFVGRVPDNIHANIHFAGMANIVPAANHWLRFVPMMDVKYHAFQTAGADDAAGNPFRKPHYLLLNLALGGSCGGPIDEAILPQQYLIDYVCVYQSTVASPSVPARGVN